jgi:5-carboxymethyl-2-hydroxymuconate isomerase
VGLADDPVFSHARHAADRVKACREGFLMPHLTLEYTDNLTVDVQALLARLHDELVATGAVNLKGIKSRAIRHTEYRIADGNPAYAFVHVNLLIREGRPIEIQQDAAQRTMAVLKEIFQSRFEDGYLSLSVDIKEMREGIAQTVHNIPEGGKNRNSEPATTP